MSLPKLDYPIIDINPLTQKQKIHFRPYLVKEEKLLAMGKEGGQKALLRAMFQVMNNCIVDPGVALNKFPLFDIINMFMQLRAASAGNIITQHWTEKAEKKDYEVSFDLKKITLVGVMKDKVEIPVKHFTLVLKYPSVGDVMAFNELDLPPAAMADKMIVSCLDMLYDKDRVFPFKDETEEDTLAFLEACPSGTHEKILEFMTSMPYLKLESSFTTKEGVKRDIVLTSIEDFFL